jgi:hypothetical protein
MINITKKRKNKKRSGGKVLASGGVGCAFSPELRCVGSKTRKRRHDRISKLMTQRHALEEYEEIEKIKQRVQSIPNYDKFFLVDNMNVCVPDKLTDADLEDFETKCKALPRDNITVANINESLDKLLSLNMANGGIPVDDFTRQFPDKMIELNRSLINLLNEGIVPMNAKGMFHCDVKHSNVLIDADMNARLIDWGLSNEYNNIDVPTSIAERSFQFNVPFSNILISAKLEERCKGEPIQYIDFILTKRGNGHYNYINAIMHVMYGDKTMSKKDVLERYTRPMLADCLERTIINGLRRNLSMKYVRRYVRDVYMPSIDLWGFVMLYFPMMEHLFNKTKTPTELDVFNHLKRVFEQRLLLGCDKPMSAEELTRDFTVLEDLLLLDRVSKTSPRKTPNSASRRK